MTKSETARLLTLIAAFDRRTIGETDVEAWHLILADLDAGDCAAAVKAYFDTRREWLMPCDVRSGAITAKRRREGIRRYVERLEQIEAENAGELHQRATAALTVGQDVTPARLLRTAVSEHKRRGVEVDTKAAAEHRARVEAARAELEAVRNRESA